MARAYNMRQRAESVEATKTRILETFRELLREKLNPDAITVEETASRAGVSAMTVARHFRTKAALIDALEAWGRDHMAGVRSAPVGDAPAAIRGLFDDYEQSGDFFLRTQALEYTRPRMHQWLNRARVLHRRWVESAFAPQLAGVPRREREEVVTALAVVCEVSTWKQLRRDLGQSRRKAESIVNRMVGALLKEEE
jgi:AcrR family transcriptional regulator